MIESGAGTGDLPWVTTKIVATQKPDGDAGTSSWVSSYRPKLEQEPSPGLLQPSRGAQTSSFFATTGLPSAGIGQSSAVTSDSDNYH